MITIIYGTSYGLVILLSSIYCAWKVKQGINGANTTNTTMPKGMFCCCSVDLGFCSLQGSLSLHPMNVEISYFS